MDARPSIRFVWEGLRAADAHREGATPPVPDSLIPIP
jgi:hypothetical protein